MIIQNISYNYMVLFNWDLNKWFVANYKEEFLKGYFENKQEALNYVNNLIRENNKLTIGGK